MIKSFIRYIQIEKRYSHHTLVSYQTDLEQFKTFLSREFPEEHLALIKSTHIRSWIVYLMGQKHMPSSVNRKITTLRSFYKFLLKRGEIETNPATKIRSLRKKKQLPHCVNKNDMIHLLEKIESEPSFANLRNHLIIELFYASGIRLAELISLKDNDINFTSASIKVLGKRK